MLNGEDVDQLMDEHLPEIHQTMIRSLQDEGVCSVANYYDIMSVQMQKILNERQFADLTPTSEVNFNDQTIVTPRGASQLHHNLAGPSCPVQCYNSHSPPPSRVAHENANEKLKLIVLDVSEQCGHEQQNVKCAKTGYIIVVID